MRRKIRKSEISRPLGFYLFCIRFAKGKLGNEKERNADKLQAELPVDLYFAKKNHGQDIRTSRKGQYNVLTAVLTRTRGFALRSY